MKKERIIKPTNKPMKIEMKELTKRIKHNQKLIDEYVKTDIFPEMQKFYFCEGHGSNFHIKLIGESFDDLYAAAMCGGLASLNRNGYDGVELKITKKRTSIIPCEYKSSSINRERVWKGPGGGLYVGLANTQARRVSLKSALSGSYKLFTEENRQSKNMLTYLVITDLGSPPSKTKTACVSVHCLSGKNVLTLLNLSSKKCRNIKLGSFMLHGNNIKNKNTYGFDKWKNDIAQIAPTLQAKEEFVKL